jgi:hypothetical protein
MRDTEGASATDMPAASMAGKATGMHTTGSVAYSAMPAPALRPHGHGKQKTQRRDGHQARHTAAL